MYNIKSPAKLNLFLHLVERNENQYHEIESVMVFLNLHDEIQIEKADKLSVDFTFNENIVFPKIDQCHNSITKVISEFSNTTNQKINLKISTRKNIPIGSGLGGGSGNAATIIKFLQKHCNHELTREQEINLALSIGCDTVACLNPNPIFVRGIGEIVTPCMIDKKLQNSHILIIYPQIISLSIESYKTFKRQNLHFSQKIELPTLISFEFIKQQHNDLTTPTEFLHDEVRELSNYLIKYDQSENIIARMSGSGSTFFVMSPTLSSIQQIQSELLNQFPDYFYTVTSIV